MTELQLAHMGDEIGGWYNFRTGQVDYIHTPSNFSNYLPQRPEVQKLFQQCLDAGQSQLEAFTATSKAYLSAMGAQP